MQQLMAVQLTVLMDKGLLALTVAYAVVEFLKSDITRL